MDKGLHGVPFVDGGTIVSPETKRTLEGERARVNSDPVAGRGSAPEARDDRAFELGKVAADEWELERTENRGVRLALEEETEALLEHTRGRDVTEAEPSEPCVVDAHLVRCGRARGHFDAPRAGTQF
jgi:hypothetical protein